MTGFEHARERWNQRFAQADGFLFGDAPNGWLVAHRGLFEPGMRVLAVADGEGRNSTWIAGLGCAVTAFDLAEVGVDKAGALARQRGVEVDLRVASVEDWDWQPEAYDAVVAIFIQFAPPAVRSAVFEGMGRTLKPGGLLVLEGYGPRQIEYKTGGPGILENLYTSELLREAFEGMQWLAWRDLDMRVEEGAGHSGRSHLVSAVLRKPQQA